MYQKNGRTSKKLVVNGVVRSYLLHLPSARSGVCPLVVNLHGGGEDATIAERNTGMSDAADEFGFAVAYPNALDDRWNDGRGVKKQNFDDVAFISQLIDHLVEEYEICPSRIYACGLSNGGMMVHRLSAELSGKLSAIATVAGSMPKNVGAKFALERPLSALIIHGTSDPIIPFDGGKVNSHLGGLVLSARETALKYVVANGLSSKPEIEELHSSDERCNFKLEKFGKETNGPEVHFYAIEEGGHCWPGTRFPYPEKVVGHYCSDINATIAALSFFDKH